MEQGRLERLALELGLEIALGPGRREQEPASRQGQGRSPRSGAVVVLVAEPLKEPEHRQRRDVELGEPECDRSRPVAADEVRVVANPDDDRERRRVGRCPGRVDP